MARYHKAPNVSYERLASVAKNGVSENHQVLPYSATLPPLYRDLAKLTNPPALAIACINGGNAVPW